IDIEVLRRSVRFNISGARRNSVTRFEVAKALMDSGLDGAEIQSIFRCEAPNVWFATVTSPEVVDSIQHFFMHPERCDRRRLTVRVLWLPTWISYDSIAIHFDYFGSVINISRETTSVGGMALETGTRVLTLIIREGDQDIIPHRAVLFGKSALIVVPGRPPICLRCQQVGHVRSQCPGRSETAARATYAKVTQPSEEAASPSSEEAASPSTGGSGRDPAIPSPGGSGNENLTRATKRSVPLVDDEGFRVSKKGKHYGASPIILSDGDIAPGQRTPVDSQEDDVMYDSSEDRLVIDEEAP
ncbi:uncharacterized protein LOC132563996, partial [Ylistrum balloti]|uniref:uncharacterized protein LOC132563996 n=1 Tax=Ylistrum balloti TaxID=509963 RepID=UPI002905E62C